MIVGIAGSTLIVMYVAILNRKLRLGGYAVIMLVPVVQGHMSANFMCVAGLIGFFAGYA
jgi:hypothetical protein